MRLLYINILFIAFFAQISYSQNNKETSKFDYDNLLFEVTKVMVHDVISPPAAARYYAYSCLAGYLVTENSIGF